MDGNSTNVTPEVAVTPDVAPATPVAPVAPTPDEVAAQAVASMQAAQAAAAAQPGAAAVQPGAAAPEAAAAPQPAPEVAPQPAPAPEVAPAQAAAPAAEAAAAPKKELTPEEQAKKKKKIIIGVVIGCVAAVVALIFLILLISILTVFKKPKINLNKYVVVNYEGYEGRGRANAVIDYAKLRSDYNNKIKIKRKYADTMRLNYFGYANATDAQIGMEYFCDSLRLNVEPSNSLHTGDEVQITWDIDDAAITEYCKVKIKHKDFTSKAEGFKQAGLFDPFEFITLSYSGIAPNGYLNIEKDYSNEMVDYISYQADRYDNLSNGDKITIKITIGNEDSFADRFGALPNVEEKEYVVEGLPAYIQSASELGDENVNKVIAQANDAIKAKYRREGSRYSVGYNVESVQYVGNYFLKPKAGNGRNGNVIYFVFKVNYSINYREESGQYGTYVAMKYSDIKNLPEEGVVVNVMDYYIDAPSCMVEDGVVVSDSFYLYGYRSLDDAFDKIVMNNIENYEYEKNITE